MVITPIFSLYTQHKGLIMLTLILWYLAGVVLALIVGLVINRTYLRIGSEKIEPIAALLSWLFLLLILLYTFAYYCMVLYEKSKSLKRFYDWYTE